MAGGRLLHRTPRRGTGKLLEQGRAGNTGSVGWGDRVATAPLMLKILTKQFTVESCPDSSFEKPVVVSVEDRIQNSTQSILCTELEGKARRVYKGNDENSLRWERVKSGVKRDHFDEFVSFLKSYVVPEGYPESVAPAYTPYMQWRAVQFFFGGAMSVFTTRSLLHALGVSRMGSASSAVAVNWVIKDGAGRVGKMLFARHGKKFDCHLKQLRFAGALLMELGAGVELATMALPQLFLPLACAASVAKNVGAVTSTSTRAPIYKAFARRENIGDVTAKGECISNIADLMGTGLGILISRKNPSLLATFAVLSCGYVLSSLLEVQAVQLPTLNRARFGVAAQVFLDTGQVPTLAYANKKEQIVGLPWAFNRPVELGAHVFHAFATPKEFQRTHELFKDEKYIMTCRPLKRRVYVVLKEGADPEDVFRATFHAHLVLQTLRGSSLDWRQHRKDGKLQRDTSIAEMLNNTAYEDRVLAVISESCKHITPLYQAFKQNAASQGWIMGESLLNPGSARIAV